MLSLTNVEIINFEDLRQQKFDVGIFSSGYESRASALFQDLRVQNFSDIVIFGFSEHCDSEIRIYNDSIYEKCSQNIIIASSKDDFVVYQTLIEVLERFTDFPELTILVDYTSMSRLWYSAILHLIRLQKKVKIEVILAYTLGDYPSQFLNSSYSAIKSLPSHEGSLSSNNKTLLVLAIGFSPFIIKSVIEEIEPNEIIGIIPIPSSNVKERYEKISSAIVDDVLTNDIDSWIKCPINNLERIFRTYAELSNSSVNKKDVIFLSLGPKIFTIASILVSQRFEQITCLYLTYTNTTIEDVKSTGDYVCNKITYQA